MEDRKAFNQHVGQYLRTRRHEAGISMDELAHETQLNPDHLGRLERGEKSPSLQIIAILSATLHFSVDDMLEDVRKQRSKHFINDN